MVIIFYMRINYYIYISYDPVLFIKAKKCMNNAGCTIS